MDEDLVSCVVSVPPIELGTVIGVLTRHGAWVDGLEPQPDVCALKARIPRGELAAFRKWLSETIVPAKFEVADEA